MDKKTRVEVQERIEELERKRFFLQMADRLDEDDKKRDRELAGEILRLKVLLDNEK